MANTTTSAATAPVIELRKLKIFPSGSEETICFTAEVFVNKKLTGYAKNSGHGGQTYCNPVQENKELYRLAEQYCATMIDPDFDSPLTLEDYIDNIVYAEFNKKEMEKFRKKILRKSVSSLLFTNTKEGEPVTTFIEASFRYTIERLLADGAGRSYIVKEIASQINKGYRLLNTNIPPEVIDLATAKAKKDLKA